MLLDFQTNVEMEKKTTLCLQVAQEFSVKADKKSEKFQSYRIHSCQIKAKIRL